MAVPPTSPAPIKAEMRAAMRAMRAAFVSSLPAGQRGALEAALAARLVPLLAGRCGVAGYAALPGEIDPRHVPFTIWPRVAGRDRALTLHLSDRAALRPGAWGILEPAPETPQAVPDAVLIPLLAADMRGNRLGYGAGHYDRTLAALPALRVGIAWDCQVVSAVSAEVWDVPLDWLVTPSQTIDCRDAAAVGDGRDRL